MEPITLDEIFMAAAAGEYSGTLPEPVTRFQYYMKKIAEGGSSVNPEDIDAAIESYLNSHDADIVTEQELSDALAGFYNKDDVDTALAGKADAADIPDVSSFIDADVDNLANYYDKNDVDDALAGKAAADHNHTGVYAPASHSHAQTDITGLDTTLAGKADTGHLHDDRYYTEGEMDTLLSGKAAASHTHDERYYTETEVDTALSGKAAASHSHDDRYYTESEIDTALSGKSNTGHLHDDRYYTEDETDTLLSGKADSSDIPDVSAFITKAVNDLTNYYTKSETYTQAEIDSMVSAIPKFAIEVVQALPLQDISPTTVYLLTVQSGQQGNMYDEYIHVGNSWELLGTQTVDLSGYYTSAQVDALLSGLPVAGHTHDDRYYTESEIDSKIQTINTAISGKAASDHTHDDRYYTETEIDNKLGGKSNTGHSHVQSDITGLDSALAGKAAVSHSHAQSDITDLDTALAGKAAVSHSHAQSDITDLDTVLAGKAAADHNHSGVYAPASHTHAQSDITGLSDALAGKAAASHSHTKSEITDLANATASAAGLMSAADKTKLDGIKADVLYSGEWDTASGTSLVLDKSINDYIAVDILFSCTLAGNIHSSVRISENRKMVLSTTDIASTSTINIYSAVLNISLNGKTISTARAMAASISKSGSNWSVAVTNKLTDSSLTGRINIYKMIGYSI